MEAVAPEARFMVAQRKGAVDNGYARDGALGTVGWDAVWNRGEAECPVVAWRVVLAC